MEELAQLRALAAQQHGVVTLDQLDRLLGRRGRLRALAEGWLTIASRGVSVLAGAPPTVDRALQIGVFQLGPAALISHEASARLHRFDRTPPDPVEFTVPRAQRGGGKGLKVHSTTDIGPTDVVRVNGFRCTSATRTILDLARVGSTRERLAAAIDSAVRAGQSSPLVLARRLADRRGPGHWGVTVIDSLMPDSGGHSYLEREFLGLLRRSGLPRPRTQIVHRRGGRHVARVDFLFDDVGLVVEVSGQRGHASDSERAIDAQRRNELQEVGRTVYEFTYRQVVDQPAPIVAMIRRFMEAASSLSSGFVAPVRDRS